jgi:hypothetical protein
MIQDDEEERPLSRSKNRRFEYSFFSIILTMTSSVSSPLKLFLIAINLLSISAIAISLLWSYKYLNGFDFFGGGRSQRFNWHPLLMSVGFLFLYGNALLSFRVLKGQNRRTIKIVHASLNGVAGICGAGGLFVVFYKHIGDNFSNLYSLHSWIGLMTVILFEVNILAGLLVFFVEQTPSYVKRFYKPYHIFFGIALIGLIVGSFITGLNEKAIWGKYSEGIEYANLPPQVILMNVYGMIVVFFGLATGYAATQKV